MTTLTFMARRLAGAALCFGLLAAGSAPLLAEAQEQTIPLASDARMVMMKRRFVLAGMSSPLPKWPEGVD